MTDPIYILIVDDRVENLVALESLLTRPGWRVVRATSGNEALQLILEHDFALVLLDVQMPDMNGFETAELMRANPKTRRIPIIFVTALSRESHYVFKGYESGAVDYIFKPIEPTILSSKVEVFGQLYLQRRELLAKQDEIATANKQLTERNHKLQEELDLARKVQLGFLPTTFPRHDRVTFGQHYLICSTLGGDIYDVFSAGKDKIGLYVADVSGHGVSAALLAGLLKMAFDSLKGPHHHILLQPDKVVARLNHMLFDKLPRDAFITLIYAIIDLESHVLQMASAGHPQPLLFRTTSGQAAFMKGAHGPALGLLQDAEYPMTQSRIDPGDQLIYFTDGITEAMNDAKREEFGDDRLLDLFKQGRHLPPDQAVETIMQAVTSHRDGTAVNDDCTLLCVQIH